MRLAAQSDLDRVVRSTRDSLYKDVKRFTEGKFDREVLAQRMDETLIGKYGRASYLGRHRAGDTTPYGEDDTRFGRMVQDNQIDRFDRFMAQIDEGRYGDAESGWDLDGLFDRVDMYADRCTGAANEAWALTLEPETLVFWQMYGLENHCSECPARQESSPFRSDNLPGYPRDGTTPCVMNCHCGLLYRTQDGREVRGFRGTDD